MANEATPDKRYSYQTHRTNPAAAKLTGIPRRSCGQVILNNNKPIHTQIDLDEARSHYSDQDALLLAMAAAQRGATMRVTIDADLIGVAINQAKDAGLITTMSTTGNNVNITLTQKEKLEDINADVLFGGALAALYPDKDKDKDKKQAPTKIKTTQENAIKKRLTLGQL